MSRQYAADDLEGMGDTIQYGFRSLIIFLLPSAFTFMLLGKEVIAVAFQRGEFTAENTYLTAQVLFAFCTGMVFVGMYNFAQRVFYSLGDYRRPIITAAISAAIDIAISVLVLIFDYPVQYLAYANSVAFTVGFIIIFIMLRNKIPFHYSKKMLITAGKVLLSLVPAFGYYLLMRRIFGGTWWEDGSTFRGLGLLAAQGGGIVIIVLLMYILLKVEFMTIIKRRRS